MKKKPEEIKSNHYKNYNVIYVDIASSSSSSSKTFVPLDDDDDNFVFLA